MIYILALNLKEQSIRQSMKVSKLVAGGEYLYHYKNATSENRFSEYDKTDSSEEGDPSDKFIKRESDGKYCHIVVLLLKVIIPFAQRVERVYEVIYKYESY